ncbi:MAG: hypothetical protein P9M14_09425 [Candidatus Alcyoniella australis]|nr:hypothetical protein [Candidatus Alcyoniella australis]
MAGIKSSIVWSLLIALALASLVSGCAEPNPDAPTGSEDQIYSGPQAPAWHHPESQCTECHEDMVCTGWNSPNQCVLCHEVQPGPEIPTITHGERPDYSCIEQGCHYNVHGGVHSDDQCLACHSY